MLLIDLVQTECIAPSTDRSKISHTNVRADVFPNSARAIRKRIAAVTSLFTNVSQGSQ